MLKKIKTIRTINHKPARKPKPTPTSADSSNVLSHRYNRDRGELHVTFKGNRKYLYHRVSPATATAFAKAPSKGTFINNHLAPFHRHTKI